MAKKEVNCQLILNGVGHPPLPTFHNKRNLDNLCTSNHLSEEHGLIIYIMPQIE